MTGFARVCLVVAGCLGSSFGAWAQQSTADSLLVASAAAPLYRQYQQTFGDQSALYTGGEYVDYTRFYQEAQGNQFFGSKEPQPSRVVYGGTPYDNVPVLYDLRTDQLVVRHPTNSFLVRLVSNKVSSFTLDDRQFVRVVGDSALNSIKTGFYELLLDDGLRLLARHSKEMLEEPANGISIVRFSSSVNLFVQQGEAFAPVTSRSSLLRLFPAQRRPLQKFIRDQKLTFKKKRFVTDAIQLLEFYRTLPPAEPAKAAKAAKAAKTAKPARK